MIIVKCDENERVQCPAIGSYSLENCNQCKLQISRCFLRKEITCALDDISLMVKYRVINGACSTLCPTRTIEKIFVGSGGCMLCKSHLFKNKGNKTVYCLAQNPMFKNHIEIKETIEAKYVQEYGVDAHCNYTSECTFIKKRFVGSEQCEECRFFVVKNSWDRKVYCDFRKTKIIYLGI